MYLRKLKVTNFKNCESAEIDLSPKINCFVGRNGAGKTNLLDAVYYLSFCKSYFALSDKQNIRHGESFFAIHGEFERDTEGEATVSCVQKEDSKKSFKYNKKEYDRLSEHIGKIPLVMISPYDRDLINGGSELRRKFIDGVISQFDSVYLGNLLQYNKALLQRNMLLRNFYENRNYDADLLELWNVQLASLAAPIHSKRVDFLKEFMPIFQNYYDIVSGTSETVEVLYDSDLHKKSMAELLEESRQHDLYSSYTNVGIHKDDLIFNIDEHPVKRYGSQGQQKSFVVAVKLAQFDFNYKKIGYKPILLLDDIFDKLDDNRVGQLVSLVGNEHFGQVLITDTQFQRIKMLLDNTSSDNKIFHVEHGVIS